MNKMKYDTAWPADTTSTEIQYSYELLCPKPNILWCLMFYGFHKYFDMADPPHWTHVHVIFQGPWCQCLMSDVPASDASPRGHMSPPLHCPSDCPSVCLFEWGFVTRVTIGCQTSTLSSDTVNPLRRRRDTKLTHNNNSLTLQKRRAQAEGHPWQYEDLS